ncbi:hypothetical protein [Mycolicibacterium hippocampi]|uniref:Uncharacterized protein n=1 Tax=Mycolicibacterium hippocampi TaxID=659824 RepID=A0A7I9ZVG3_9MYCO|nr:hypothetical protein [Mycolicibacterium hippocampi]GFH05040.1 hypothetical protein MHIP_55230 [Mycolicibacterium hippocampi]
MSGTDWETLNFTPLKGWINVFKDEDNTINTSPCPGVLTQRGADGENRVIFAAAPQRQESFELLPVDFYGERYVRSTTVDDWEWQRVMGEANG